MQLTTITKDKHLVIPDDTTAEQWADIHGSIMLAKRMAGKWLKASREYGEKHFGLDFVAETEVQMEFTLGIEVNDKDESSNAKDKSKAIVTIEGITQSFKLWQRKIKDDIDNWDKDRLGRALALLEPIEAQARAIRERINADKA
jgi:hypothetical protein